MAISVVSTNQQAVLRMSALHLLRLHPEEEPICTKRYSDKTLTVSGFQAYTAQVFLFSLMSSFLISQTTVSVFFLTVVD